MIPARPSYRRVNVSRTGCTAGIDHFGLLLQRAAREDLLDGDHPLGAAAAQECNRPVEERREAVPEPGQEGEVHYQPQEPRDEAGGLDPADQGDGAEAGDRRHRPAIVVPERPAGRVSRKPTDDGLGGVTPRLNRDLGYPGQPVEAHQVADDEDFGVPRKGEVRLDLHPARAIHFGTSPVGEQSSQGRALHAGGPDLGGRFDPAQLRVGRVGLQTALVDMRDRGVHVDLDPERARGRARRASGARRGTRGGSSARHRATAPALSRGRCCGSSGAANGETARRAGRRAPRPWAPPRPRRR